MVCQRATTQRANCSLIWNNRWEVRGTTRGGSTRPNSLGPNHIDQISKANIWYVTSWLSPTNTLPHFNKHAHFLSFSLMGSSARTRLLLLLLGWVVGYNGDKNGVRACSHSDVLPKIAEDHDEDLHGWLQYVPSDATGGTAKDPWARRPAWSCGDPIKDLFWWRSTWLSESKRHAGHSSREWQL